MDPLAALRDEISKKRKSNAAAAATPPAKKSSSTARPEPPVRRWRSQADIERDRERAYHACQQAAQQAKLAKKSQRSSSSPLAIKPTVTTTTNPPQKLSSSPARSKSPTDKPSTTSAPEEAPPLSVRDVIKRLRALKQPATLFGEDAWMRFHRLRDLQLNHDDQSDGQRNLYQKKMREVRAKHAEEDVYAYTRATLPAPSTTDAPSDRRTTPGTGNDGTTDSALDGRGARTGSSSAATCKEDYVQSAIQNYMGLWLSDVYALSKEESRTSKGRSQLVTYEQTKQWLQPLQKLLRRRTLSKTILDALRDIFASAARREYLLAMRLYLERLAIGNAPWPMGATQVGIHSRAAREKIGEDKIAHVMNDEPTRKYIQAVKRLLTVAQRHFPTDHSKMAST